MLYHDQRLETVTKNSSQVAAYQYEGRGLRTVKTVNGQTTLFVYDRSGNLIAEADGQCNIQREYVYLEGKVFAHFQYDPAVSPAALVSDPTDEEPIQDNPTTEAEYSGPIAEQQKPFPAKSSTVQAASSNAPTSIAPIIQLLLLNKNNPAEGAYYYITDHLGTPQIITDDSGTVVWQAVYKPFWKAIISVNLIENNLRFMGQYYDAETGFHANWHRVYDPGSGRYLSADPIGLDGGINLYAYVGGNPVNAIDPMGLHRWPGSIEGTSVLPTGACHSGKPTNIYWNIEGGSVVTGGISHEVCCDGDDKMLITNAEICTGVASGVEVSFAQDSTEIPKCSGKKMGDFSFGTETGGSYFVGVEFDTSFDESGGSVSISTGVSLGWAYKNTACRYEVISVEKIGCCD